LETKNIGAIMTGNLMPVISVNAVFTFMEPKYHRKALVTVP
jgi:hypothetical protein